ncbi:hypothetical protein R1sor_004011 [Riccia sorocarpa]|uniref:Uncharacterized protein n=1 Tax=Riccia sorocarpa TaxID=122646 RepID=A0ABD3H768_9MARC
MNSGLSVYSQLNAILSVHVQAPNRKRLRARCSLLSARQGSRTSARHPLHTILAMAPIRFEFRSLDRMEYFMSIDGPPTSRLVTPTVRRVVEKTAQTVDVENLHLLRGAISQHPASIALRLLLAELETEQNANTILDDAHTVFRNNPAIIAAKVKLAEARGECKEVLIQMISSMMNNSTADRKVWLKEAIYAEKFDYPSTAKAVVKVTLQTSLDVTANTVVTEIDESESQRTFRTTRALLRSAMPIYYKSLAVWVRALEWDQRHANGRDSKSLTTFVVKHGCFALPDPPE